MPSRPTKTHHLQHMDFSEPVISAPARSRSGIRKHKPRKSFWRNHPQIPITSTSWLSLGHCDAQGYVEQCGVEVILEALGTLRISFESCMPSTTHRDNAYRNAMPRHVWCCGGNCRGEYFLNSCTSVTRASALSYIRASGSASHKYDFGFLYTCTSITRALTPTYVRAHPSPSPQVVLRISAIFVLPLSLHVLP